jgi:zona occludens toxin
MPTTIYYGPPGAYKTSSGLIDFFTDAVFSGRPVVTNIRGMDDRENIVKVLENSVASTPFGRFLSIFFGKRKHQDKKVPDDWEFHYISSEELAGKKRWQKFFHEIPYGSLVFIDEAQQIWRKELRAKELAAFDYPGGEDQASADNRPVDIKDAFERHRHFNWDFVITCQHLSQLHDLIRQTAEMAHKHVNLASVMTFMKGHYIVRTHSADQNYSEKNTINERNRVIQKWVFDLYKSTATDEVKDTNAGISLWRNPKFTLPIIGIVVLSTYLFFFGEIPFLAAKRKNDAIIAASTESSANSGKNVMETAQVPFADLGKNSADVGDNIHLFKGNTLISDFWIVGELRSRGLLFEVSGEDESSGIILDQLAVQNLGYEIEKITSCLAMVSKKGEEQYVRCRGTISKNKKKSII